MDADGVAAADDAVATLRTDATLLLCALLGWRESHNAVAARLRNATAVEMGTLLVTSAQLLTAPAGAVASRGTWGMAPPPDALLDSLASWLGYTLDATPLSWEVGPRPAAGALLLYHVLLSSPLLSVSSVWIPSARCSLGASPDGRGAAPDLPLS